MSIDGHFRGILANFGTKMGIFEQVQPVYDIHSVYAIFSKHMTNKISYKEKENY